MQYNITVWLTNYYSPFIYTDKKRYWLFGLMYFNTGKWEFLQFVFLPFIMVLN